MRVWLQSTSLLAVVAGYTLLFALVRFGEAERLDRHQRLVDQMLNGLRTGAATLAALPPGFGVQASVVPGCRISSSAAPTLRLIDGRLLVDQPHAACLSNASNACWRCGKNITASVAANGADQLLLIAAAGMSLLLTCRCCFDW